MTHPAGPARFFRLSRAADGNAHWRIDGDFGRARIGDAEIVVEGRIYRLGTHEPALACADPHARAQALLHAWLARGPQALVEAVGDFVAVRVDPGVTYAYRSLTTQFQLYHDTAGRLSNRLLALGGSETAPGNAPAVDTDYLLRLLMVAPGIQHALPQTPFRHIQRLRPWHLLTLRPGQPAQERQLAARDYRWGRASAASLEDVGVEIRRLLETAVEDRLAADPARTPVCEISGGLDSSFAACLVARASTRPVQGVMYAMPARPSHQFGELAAQAVADRWNIDLRIVRPEQLGDGDLSETGPYAEEPTDFFWYSALFGRWAAEQLPRGSLLFTGYASDALFMRSPLILPWLLARRQWRAFGRTAADIACFNQRSAVALAWQAALAQLPRPVYLRLSAPFAGRRWNPFEVLDVTAEWNLREAPTWLRHPHLRALHETVEREGRAADRALVGDGVVRDDSVSWIAHRRIVSSPWFDTADIQETSPYVDQRLMDFVWGEVDWTLIHDFRAPYKALLREAQRGIVPEAVRMRGSDTFFFNTFRANVIGRNEVLLRALLEEGAARHPDLLDAGALQRTMDELMFGKHHSSSRSLFVLLGFLLWERDLRAHARPFAARMAPLSP